MMAVPLDTDVNIEKMWYGPESAGRNSGEPGIFLYYGSEGVDKEYTVRSIRNQVEGYNWDGRISSHGADIVFTSFMEEEQKDTDPLSNKYEREILDLLDVLDHHDVRVHTPGYSLPTDAIDDAVDHYTLGVSGGKYRNYVDERSEVAEWYANESRYRDRVDFVFGHDGLRKNQEYLSEFQRLYEVSRERIWAYPDFPDESKHEEMLKTVNQVGNRICLPPDYYRSLEDADGESD